MSNVPQMRGQGFSLKPFLDWMPLDDCSVLEIGCFAGEGTVEFLECDDDREAR